MDWCIISMQESKRLQYFQGFELESVEEGYCYIVIFQGSLYQAFKHAKEWYYSYDNWKSQGGIQSDLGAYYNQMTRQDGAEQP